MEQNILKKRFRKYCAVTTCGTSSDLVSYHRFPNDLKRRCEWHKMLEINREVKKFTYVCSKHFKHTDFFPCASTSRRKLKRNAVPTLLNVETSTSVSRKPLPQILMCEQTLNVEEKDENSSGIQNQFDDQEISEQINIPHTTDSESSIDEQRDIVPEEPDQSEKIQHFVDSDHSYFKTNNPNEISAVKCVNCVDYVNVLSENHDLKLENDRKDSIITKLEKENLILNISLNSISSQHISHTMFALDDDLIKYYTGFINYAAFTAVFKYILPSGNAKDIIYENNGKKFKQVCKLNAQDQFLLFLIKMRRDFDYKHIAFLFNISESTACRIFQSWLYMTYFRLGSLNIWPHRNVLLANAPKKFKEKYPQVIAVIGCTEIYTESPSHKQSHCYSNHKNDTTLKGLIATDPKGEIIFVSQLYTDTISDVKIIESNFVNIVKNKLKTGEICAGDIILADKGFNIGDILEPVKINLSSFKTTIKSSTDDEINNPKKKSSARVHIERAIRQIKTFKILKNIKILQHCSISRIWTVCALLSNFMIPVVTNNEVNEPNMSTVQLINE